MARADDLKHQVERYAQKYGLGSNLEKGLEAYAVHLFAQEEGFDSILAGDETFDADLSDYILHRDDLGVDGALFDDAGQRILLIQATWRQRLRPDVEQKLSSFSCVVDRLVDPSFIRNGGEQAQELLGALGDQIRDGYSIELRFVTNLKVGDKERLQDVVSAANQGFDDTNRRISLELLGGSELLWRAKELEHARTGGTIDEVKFNVQADKALLLDSPRQAPKRTLVCVIKGNELADLYKKCGDRLFTSNIRLPLLTKKVNPDIKATAEEHPAEFFYYNNGVSAVCKNFDFEGNMVTAKRFQIINGAQTVDSLQKALNRKPNSELYVLFRLTETEEGYGSDFTDSIVRFNNTQTPVKVSDFFSNDPIQLWLSDNLPAQSGKPPIPVFYYVHKAGFRPSKYKGRKQLKIDAFAGIRHAFIYGPTISYREPASFFDRNGRYNEAFGMDGTVVNFWNEETLAQALCAIAINDRVQTIARDLKKDIKTREVPEARYLYRMSRYVTALVGVGLRSIVPDRLTDFRSLIASQDNFDRFVDPILNKAREFIEDEMLNLSEKSVQPEYNFARDDKSWMRLETRMNSAALTRIKF